ncbi:e9imm peptide [Paenibacillus jamilae]|uniref:E9imm peptide n=2 Tax=Paenibacillus TaxID=44249 RepID=E3EFT8_PAEPS|nr:MULTISPECIES: bacteriocin immunity protein [Paenibacillus]MCV9950808.1 bacteriocin immunity protein [Paenibacillus sp. BT-177]ADO55810.1 e9imm peptide [Paenibacillus polymyxa SC2]AUO09468.1 e9imm peptide [Paenibacillus sp. lzh-N1]AZH28863.1 bacteriocin immunity protein [Paenibacillus sp. M-152]KAF6559394.1 bacteriocin immunity protein [Paenibacillus sp. EKM202P]
MSLDRNPLKLQKLNRSELIQLVDKIIRGEGTEEELDSMLTEVMQNTPHPGISNLIYWDDRDLSAAEIVDEALAYQPIILPPHESSS